MVTASGVRHSLKTTAFSGTDSWFESPVRAWYSGKDQSRSGECQRSEIETTTTATTTTAAATTTTTTTTTNYYY